MFFKGLEIKKKSFLQNSSVFRPDQPPMDLVEDCSLLLDKNAIAAYFSLFDRLSIGIYRVLENGKIIDGNPFLRKTLGFTDQHDLLKSDFSQWFQNPSDFKDWHNQIFEQNTFSPAIYPWQKQDGSTIWVRDSARKITDPEGNTLFIEGIVEDISAIRLTEEAYRTLVDQSSQGMLIIQDKKVVFANNAMSQITGGSHEELTSMTYTDILATILPEDLPVVLEKINGRVAGNKENFVYHFRFTRKDNQIRWIEMRSTVINYLGKPATQK